MANDNDIFNRLGEVVRTGVKIVSILTEFMHVRRVDTKIIDLRRLAVHRVANATSPQVTCFVCRNNFRTRTVVHMKFAREGTYDPALALTDATAFQCPAFVSIGWVDSALGVVALPYGRTMWPLRNNEELSIWLEPGEELYSNDLMTGAVGWLYWVMEVQ